MINALKYSDHNKRAWRDNCTYLEENIHKMKWRGGDKVIDIGSADGGFTSEGLTKFLPQDIGQLLGVDKSSVMVDHANMTKANEVINFAVLDISKELPKEYIGYFDHVFSFNSINWVLDQKKAFSNVYDLLAPNGDCSLVVIGTFSVFFDIYDIFARSDKWGTWVKDLENVVSPYRFCTEPEKIVRSLLKAAGFQDIEVECKKYEYAYDSIDEFKKSVKAVSAFEIPVDKSDEYLEEFTKTAQDKGFLSQDLKIEYDLIHIHCKKKL